MLKWRFQIVSHLFVGDLMGGFVKTRVLHYKTYTSEVLCVLLLLLFVLFEKVFSDFTESKS